MSGQSRNRPSAPPRGCFADDGDFARHLASLRQSLTGTLSGLDYRHLLLPHLDYPREIYENSHRQFWVATDGQLRYCLPANFLESFGDFLGSRDADTLAPKYFSELRVYRNSRKKYRAFTQVCAHALFTGDCEGALVEVASDLASVVRSLGLTKLDFGIRGPHRESQALLGALDSRLFEVESSEGIEPYVSPQVEQLLSFGAMFEGKGLLDGGIYRYKLSDPRLPSIGSIGFCFGVERLVDLGIAKPSEQVKTVHFVARTALDPAQTSARLAKLGILSIDRLSKPVKGAIKRARATGASRLVLVAVGPDGAISKDEVEL